MLLFMIIALLCVVPHGLLAWVNEYDQHFAFTCPKGEGIKIIESRHSNSKEDRQFNFVCARVVPEDLTDCVWGEWANDFDRPVDYQCPNEFVIAGVESYHDNKKEDRRFKFYCCKPGSYISHACALTPYVNSYDQFFSYRVPDGYGLRGVHSVHDNNKEDRIFKFDICKLDKFEIPEVGK